MSERDYTLNDVAERLGVHYMTVYRYVRTGRLAARQQGTQWLVREDELWRFEEAKASRAKGTVSPLLPPRPSVERLVARLTVGDEAGSWAIAQESLVSGATPREIYLELFVPAMRMIGLRWAEGALSVTDEHRASVVMHRLVGRMGPQFRPRGPRVGTVILGAPAGEMHALPTAFAADLLHLEGLNVIDLGANVPADAFVTCAQATDNLRAVAVSVTSSRHVRSAATLIGALRASELGTPIVVGGAVLGERDARVLGADRWVPDVDGLISFLRHA